MDPMCGGGTIVIEAAMMARKIPPGYFRFAKREYPNLKLFPYEQWQPIIAKANDEIRWDYKCEIWARDIDPNAIKSARENALLAGVQDCIKFETKDARLLHQENLSGLVVTNPPFGIRLGKKMEIPYLYTDFLKSAATAGIQRIVLTSPRNIKNIPPCYELSRTFSFIYGRFTTHIFRFDICGR
ncbi:MAG: hypothetical protein QXL15_03155 [Candidatus Korarchaeota archaeon]